MSTPVTYTPSPTATANGTSFTGVYVLATYNELVALFGTHAGPGSFDGKVSAQWVFVGTDGTVATVYDYKCSFNIRRNPNRVVQWHVGANTRNVLAFTQQYGLVV